MFPSTAVRRRPPLPGVLLALLLLAAAGCSSDSGGDSPSASSASRSAAATTPTAGGSQSTVAAGSGTPTAAAGSATSAATGPDRCHTSQLSGRLSAGDAGAGQRSAVLTLENTGGQTCRIEGFGGIGLVGADGQALPTQQVRVESPEPALITLAPGAGVTSQLRWTAVPTGSDPASGCPTPVSIAVIPPDETDALTVTWSSGPVCDGGTVQQQAYAGG